MHIFTKITIIIGLVSVLTTSFILNTNNIIITKAEIENIENYDSDYDDKNYDRENHGNIIKGSRQADAGENSLFGTEAKDTISGLGGDDVIVGKKGSDSLFGNQGRDTIFGGEGDDSLHGGKGNDWMQGGLGDDVLYADKGENYDLELLESLGISSANTPDEARASQAFGRADIIFGEDGKDTLVAGPVSKDEQASFPFTYLKGGLGEDTYYILPRGEDGGQAAVVIDNSGFTDETSSDASIDGLYIHTDYVIKNSFVQNTNLDESSGKTYQYTQLQLADAYGDNVYVFILGKVDGFNNDESAYSNRTSKGSLQYFLKNQREASEATVDGEDLTSKLAFVGRGSSHTGNLNLQNLQNGINFGTRLSPQNAQQIGLDPRYAEYTNTVVKNFSDTYPNLNQQIILNFTYEERERVGSNYISNVNGKRHIELNMAKLPPSNSLKSDGYDYYPRALYTNSLLSALENEIKEVLIDSSFIRSSSEIQKYSLFISLSMESLLGTSAAIGINDRQIVEAQGDINKLRDKFNIADTSVAKRSLESTLISNLSRGIDGYNHQRTNNNPAISLDMIELNKHLFDPLGIEQILNDAGFEFRLLLNNTNLPVYFPIRNGKIPDGYRLAPLVDSKGNSTIYRGRLDDSNPNMPVIYNSQQIREGYSYLIDYGNYMPVGTWHVFAGTENTNTRLIVRGNNVNINTNTGNSLVYIEGLEGEGKAFNNNVALSGGDDIGIAIRASGNSGFNGGLGNDIIRVSSSDDFIANGGGGDDSIYIFPTSTNAKVSGDKGADVIINFSETTTIKTSGDGSIDRIYVPGGREGYKGTLDVDPEDIVSDLTATPQLQADNKSIEDRVNARINEYRQANASFR